MKQKGLPVRQTGLAPILIVLLIATLAVGGYLIYSQQPKPAPRLQQTNKPFPTPTLSPTFLEQKQPSASPQLTESSSQSQNGLTFEETRAAKPYPPDSIEAQRTANGVLVTWPRIYSDLTRESDVIREYRVYRRANESSNWQLITTITALPESHPYARSSHSYLDSTTDTFEYTIALVSVYGTEGFKGPIAKPAP